jgi:hypothetical protein
VKWITREAKGDRAAYRQLIAWFVDREAEFLFVHPSDSESGGRRARCDSLRR